MDTITPPSGHNLPPVLSVSELSTAVRRKVEEFGTVRVRGEISQPRVVGSGHCYLRLKDAEAVLEAVIWRSVLRRIALAPEDGMEVICTGRITTYPGKSTYQIVVDAIELAGEGALLKMIEERRRRLAAEGLFDAARKRPLPYLPEIIGVVTSPTGAVIRDILHRLEDRFPRRVLLWPAAVQGEGAAEEIAAAIRGFGGLPAGGPAPRPDLVIVARGGGSLEDLMAFNEEVVVRAVAECTIPLISAVGHETDTTLIDHAADKRAPTPTAAAEMAVPVRTELVAQVADDGSRMVVAITRWLREQRVQVGGLARGLPDPARLIGTATQSLDDRAERLRLAVGRLFEAQRAAVDRPAYRLPPPREQISRVAQRLEDRGQRLALGGAQAMVLRTRALDGLAVRLRRPDTYLARDRQRLEATTSRIGLLARKSVQFIRRDMDMLDGLDARLGRACGRAIGDLERRLGAAGALLESISYQHVLDRGFVLVKDAGGRLVTSAEQVRRGQDVVLRFRGEAEVPAVISGPAKAARDTPKSREKKADAPSEPTPRKTNPRQGRLL